ncbi:MAG: HPr family phosphocarrier protein [Anaerolineae bacterium]|jgi:phosphocarrier protein HPr|nr:HPr family phosphocarrier protein [Anaerolineae bacterium]MBT7990962.1 HPr family phosphocarrier protein [Anaerolineae bacterium]
MLETKLTINHPEGLHARPAAEFVKIAQQFQSEITVTVGKWKADAKSILEILTLGANQGTEMHIIVKGDDEKEAIEAVTNLVKNNFGDQFDEAQTKNATVA